jgi:ankyrin repeat protein
MTRELTTPATLESLKKEAKRWLKAVRAGDEHACARLIRAYPKAPAEPALRDVQHALATEHGFQNWASLKKKMAEDHSSRSGASRESTIKAFLDAAHDGDAAGVGELLDRHPDIIDERRALPGHSGLRTALHYAMNAPHEAVVRCLLERGANPNIRDEGDAATPLHFAAEKQHLRIIRLLIEHGAEPIAEGDYHELDVIGWATGFDYLKTNQEVVDYLIAHGAKHNIFSAVAMGDVEAIRLLVAQSRSNLDKRMDLTNKRRMPLHLAVIKHKPNSLATLLELGANTEALDERGLTPLDHAALIGAQAMAQVLIDRGAEIRLPAAVALQRTRDIEMLLREDQECLKPGHRWGHLIVMASYLASGDVIETLIR